MINNFNKKLQDIRINPENFEKGNWSGPAWNYDLLVRIEDCII